MTTFAPVLEALKSIPAVRARRAIWPEGSFIYMVPGSNFVVSRPPLAGIYEHGTEIQYMPHIDFAFGDGRCCVWQLSQDNLLAEDWELQQPSA